MMMKMIQAGMLDSNCYILGDGGEAAVIDPGADHDDIAKVLDEHGLTLKYIILTHAHIDHIIETDILRSSRGGKVVIHEADAPHLSDPLLNGSILFGISKVFGSADILVKDGDMLELGNTKLYILHTPGHTPGGICVMVNDAQGGGAGNNSSDSSDSSDSMDSRSDKENEDRIGKCIFTGDTLFRLGVGRTDLGAGDYDQLLESLKRLMELDDDVRVYPGHGPATDIGYERQYNPWL